MAAHLRHESYSRRRLWWALALLALTAATIALGIVVSEGWSALLPIGAVLFALLAIAWLAWALFRDRARGRRRCSKCWYDMSGTEGLRCPECGREAKREKTLFKTRRHWRLAMVALFPILMSLYLAMLPRIREHGWQAALPTTALIWCLELDDNDWVFDELTRRANSDLPAGTWMSSMPMSGDAFLDWQWRLIGSRCLEILESDAPMQKRYAMMDWLTFGRSERHGDPMVERINAALIRLLEDPAPQIRGRAALGVAFGDDPIAAVERLRPMLRDEDARARRGAVMGLRFLSQSSDAAVILAGTALDDADGSVRVAAISVIGSAAEYRVIPNDIIGRVRQMASDDNASVRYHQVLTMMRLLDVDAARAELLQAFNSGDSDRRGGAIWALKMDDRFQPREFVGELVAALTDAGPIVREDAASALGYVEFNEIEPFEEQLKAAIDPNAYPETAWYLQHHFAEFHHRDTARLLDDLE